MKYTKEQVKEGLQIIIDAEESDLQGQGLDGRRHFNRWDLAEMVENSYTCQMPSANTISNWLKSGRVHPDYKYSVEELLDQVYQEDGRYYLAYIGSHV